MDARPPLSKLTPQQLWELAQQNREQAKYARTADVRNSLLRLAERLEALAVQREGGERL